MIKNEGSIRWQSLVDRQVQLWQKRDEDAPKKSGLDEDRWNSSLITISRAYGARGYRIGELIAEKLDWQVYSRQLVEYIADSTNLRHKVVADFDEKKKQHSLSNSLFDPKAYSSNKHYRHLVQVILSIADHGRAVIVGRGASFIAEKENNFRVLVTAPIEHRIHRYANQMKLSYKEAKKIVENKDKERADYISHYFKADVMDARNYDLVINVEHLTNEQVARTIVSALGIRLGSLTPDNTTVESKKF